MCFVSESAQNGSSVTDIFDSNFSNLDTCRQPCSYYNFFVVLLVLITNVYLFVQPISMKIQYITVQKQLQE